MSETTNKRLRFLFNTLEAFGTVNPMISLAKLLKSRGHEIVFVSKESFRQTIENCGFIYVAKQENVSELSNPKASAELITSIGMTTAKSSLESMKIMLDSKFMTNILLHHRVCEQNIIKNCIEKYKPDIIVTNNLLGSAESVYSGIPWVGVYCESPIIIYQSEVLPPFCSGYATNGDPKDWKDFNLLLKANQDILSKEINSYYRERGFPEINTYYSISPNLNIYAYPKELDYSEIVPVPQNWFRIDSFFSNQFTGDFTLPKQLDNNCGKLVYVSMGTIGSMDLDFMRKLVEILSKSPHRFIVSKGMLSSEYELNDNMWGELYLPQTLILPKVDLVITHGGNNTITETFYFGKPMIVMPLFLDQYDNAQRVHETGFGIRLNAQLFTEIELLSAIETLLNDRELSDKLEKLAKRIQSDKRMEMAAEMIENLVK